MTPLTIIFKDKVVDPLINLLKQGLTPSKVAAVVAIGFSFGLFPIIGVHAIICTGIAFLFRLNLIVIQFAHLIAFPFQIFMFFPFLKIGEIVSNETLETVSESFILATFNKGIFHSVKILSEYILLACLGWIIFVIPFIFVVYFFSLKGVHWFVNNFQDAFFNPSKR